MPTTIHMSPLKEIGYCLALCGVRSAERSLAIQHDARLNQRELRPARGISRRFLDRDGVLGAGLASR